jgi:uroporphyrinogen decarboxylase
MPPGMKAIGGVGCGIFESVQDLVGYESLCYMREDDPELYAGIFKRIGDLLAAVWKRVLSQYGDTFAVCRMGDDLGFKTSTLLIPEDIRKHIIPQYKRVVDMVHAQGKPFLWHSCGCIFDIMDDVIRDAGIDAKHSNEDQIAPFQTWVDRYGDRIGNFGGVDVNVLCLNTESEIRAYVLDVIRKAEGYGGIAISSGNSIPDYVPAAGYLAMIETVREYRGE